MMFADKDWAAPKPNANPAVLYLRKWSQISQSLLDKSAPHIVFRWTFSVVLITALLARVIWAEGWYIILYALGIYHLNLLISFLSPKIDPAFAHLEDSGNDGPELPTTVDEEFRPFIRKLPEFKFWYSVWKSTLIALFCTLFGVFDVPVFWPILVGYFIALFCLTMKRQIKHMIKYRYLPFTHGKPKYAEADYGNWLRATPKK